ncbi:MAG: hypothetical protein WCO33_00605 [bacterium]
MSKHIFDMWERNRKRTELQSEMLHEVTRNKLTNPDIPIIDLAGKILAETNLKLYTARFNEPLDLLN